MKTFIQLIFLALIFLALPKAAFSKDAYKLDATKSNYKFLKVFIDQSGSKLMLHAERGDIILIPPYKFKVVLNPENKLYMPIGLFGIGPTEERFVQVGKASTPTKTRLCSYNCRKYSFKVKSPERAFLNAEVVSTDGLRLQNGLNQAFYGVLGLNGMKGFPLSYTIKLKDGTRKIVFKVDRIAKGKVDRSKFLVPANYKRAKSLAALIFSEDGKFGKNELNDFFRSKF